LRRTLKRLNFDELKAFASFSCNVIHFSSLYPYFLCLDAKKVTKKNQGKPERSALFALPTPHYASKMHALCKKIK